MAKKKDYVPRRNAELGPYGTNMSQIVTANPTILGLTTSIASTLAALVAAWLIKFDAAQGDATRGKSTLYAAKVAAKELRDYIREIAAIIHATPTVTDQQLVDLGLTVRSDHRVPEPVPGYAPLLRVKKVVGNVVEIEARDPQRPSSKARPASCDGITVMTFVGETPPTSKKGWDLAGNTSLMTTQIPFPGVEPGTRVHIVCWFYNSKGESGPCSEVVSTQIQFGGGLTESA